MNTGTPCLSREPSSQLRRSHSRSHSRSGFGRRLLSSLLRAERGLVVLPPNNTVEIAREDTAAKAQPTLRVRAAVPLVTEGVTIQLHLLLSPSAASTAPGAAVLPDGASLRRASAERVAIELATHKNSDGDLCKKHPLPCG